jgi:hypothetical protein
MPSSGNPHNQLAVLATYTEAECVAVYRYASMMVMIMIMIMMMMKMMMMGLVQRDCAYPALSQRPSRD